MAIGGFPSKPRREQIEFEVRGLKISQSLYRQGFGTKLIRAMVYLATRRAKFLYPDAKTLMLTIPPSGECHKSMLSLLLYAKNDWTVTKGDVKLTVEYLVNCINSNKIISNRMHCSAFRIINLDDVLIQPAGIRNKEV